MMTTQRLAAHWIVAMILVTHSCAANLLPDDEVKLLCEVRKLEACPEYKNLPFSFDNMNAELDPESQILYVSATLNASRPLQAGTKGLVKMFRCNNDNDDSCERYIEVEVKDFCAHLSEQDKSWSPVVANLKNFDPSCPVPPGVYELFEAPLETKNMKNRYSMAGHWQMEVVVEYEDEVVACLVGDAIISLDRNV